MYFLIDLLYPFRGELCTEKRHRSSGSSSCGHLHFPTSPLGFCEVFRLEMGYHVSCIGEVAAEEMHLGEQRSYSLVKR